MENVGLAGTDINTASSAIMSSAHFEECLDGVSNGVFFFSFLLEKMNQVQHTSKHSLYGMGNRVSFFSFC